MHLRKSGKARFIVQMSAAWNHLEWRIQVVGKLLRTASPDLRSEVGRRGRQHSAVVEAAQRAGVRFLSYTSILHADDNPISLAAEHRATEAMIKRSGKPVRHLDVPEIEFRTTLERAGLPSRFARMVSEASARSADDVIFDGGRVLSGLIGPPTTPLRTTLRHALRA